MAIFDSIKDTLNKGVATVSVKSESLVESSRVKAAIGGTQKKLDTALAALGARFYQLVKAGQVEAGALDAEVTELQGMEQELQELQARLEQIKDEESKILGGAGAKKPAAAPGGSFCTACGKALAPGARFCDECGTPLN